MRSIRIDSETTAFNSAFGSNLLAPDDCVLRFDSATYLGFGESSEPLSDIEARRNVLLAGGNSDYEEFEMGKVAVAI